VEKEIDVYSLLVIKAWLGKKGEERTLRVAIPARITIILDRSRQAVCGEKKVVVISDVSLDVGDAIDTAW
jgi:hypothetical protein